MLLAPLSAIAGSNDFKLHRLATCAEGTVPGESCIADPDFAGFDAFSKRMGLVFAPSFLAPADSLGQAGFAIGLETKFAVAAKDESWRALNGVDFDTPPLFALMQLHVRKGLPFSLELDGLMSWLIDSELFYVGGGLKWAVTEGWWFLPDLAVRGHGGTLVGSPDLNLVNAGFDVSLSYSFGLGGVVNLTPYAGFSYVWVISSSRVIDADPGWGVSPSGAYSPEFVFSQKTQGVPRGFFGLRFIADYVAVTIEGAMAAEVQTFGVNLGTSF